MQKEMEEKLFDINKAAITKVQNMADKLATTAIKS